MEETKIAPNSAKTPSSAPPRVSNAALGSPSLEAARTIVDVDGGGTLKGNLLGVEPDPAKIKFDMPVNIVIRPVPQKDKDGNSYLAYFFEPRT